MNALENKLFTLIRFHRHNAFNAKSGDAHTRAIVRLKRTRTFAQYSDDRQHAASQRLLARLDREG